MDNSSLKVSRVGNFGLWIMRFAIPAMAESPSTRKTLEGLGSGCVSSAIPNPYLLRI